MIQEPDITEILRLTSIVLERFDSKWIYDEIQKNKNSQGKNLITHSYLYTPKHHPIIDLFIEFERWKEECLKTGKMELSQGILRLYSLGLNLEAAQNQKHFEKICSRLRIPEQFHAAEFELEVAKSYLNRKYSVEFIEEGKNKSPDLFVTGTNKKSFYVECKVKNLPERDSTQQKIIKNIEQRLIKFMGLNNYNFFITISIETDLKFSDVEPISKMIIDEIKKNKDIFGEIKELKYSNPVQIVLQNIVKPNEEIDTNSISINSPITPTHLTFLHESRVDENKIIKIRNPKVIAFFNTSPSDKIKGILKSLHKAVPQLPPEGPGVIWIRIPDNIWHSNIENSFLEAKKLIEKELEGEKNRRVNAVIIVTKIFRNLKKGKLDGVSYTPVTLLIPHKNPRNPS